MSQIAFHGYALQKCAWSFVEGVSTSRSPRGQIIAAVEYADPYLHASFQTGLLSLEQRHGWEAWKDSLRGGLNSFLAYDASRPEPLAYPGGVPSILASTWNGEGDVTGLAAYQITATGAPSGFIMSPGDHIGLVESNRYGLFRVAAQATAGGSNIVVTVNPGIPLTLFTTAATAVFWRPKAEFIMLADTWSNPVDAEFTPISFEAVQKL